MSEEIERIKKEKMEEFIKHKGGKMVEIEVNDSNFREKVIEQSSRVPVVVDFWATWCMPCVMLSPILEKLAREYDGKFILAKANVDEARASAQEYRVMSIPAVKMFKDGKVIDEFIGLRPEDAIKQWLDSTIGD